MINITFNNSETTRKFVLSLFNKKVDEDGFIVEEATNERVIDSQGHEMLFKEFGAIKNGSEIFVKNNIVSLVEFYQKYLAHSSA